MPKSYTLVMFSKSLCSLITVKNIKNTKNMEEKKSMEFIEKGEKAPCSGVFLNKTEHHCYSEFIKQLPEFKRYLVAQEERKYNTWD